MKGAIQESLATDGSHRYESKLGETLKKMGSYGYSNTTVSNRAH